MTDQAIKTIAVQSMTAAEARRGMILLVRYLRVRRDWYTGGSRVEAGRMGGLGVGGGHRLGEVAGRRGFGDGYQGNPRGKALKFGVRARRV